MATANPVLDMVQSTIETLQGQNDELVTQVTAATKDGVSLAQDILQDESVTDETVVKWRQYDAQMAEAREQAHKQILDDVKARLLPASNMTDEQVEAAKVSLKEIREQFKAALTFAKAAPGYSEDYLKVPELKSLRGGTTGGNKSGGRRPRLNWIKVNGEVAETKHTDPKTKEEVTSSTFSTAAKVISKASGAKVEVSDLQSAAFEAAKTDDLSTLSGVRFSFSYTSGDKNFDIEVEPKAAE